MYEMDEPYCYYQYLIVNGVAMDGHNDTPRIFRYTGGKATPEVQCWIRDKNGDYMIDSISRTDADFGDWYAGYVNAAGYVNN